MSRESRVVRRGTPTAGVAIPTDRRFRRSDLPSTRRRRLGRIWSVARVAVVVVALALAASWATGWLVASNLFVIREISVRGNARLSAADIESLLDGLRGENVFRVDFEHYRQRVLTSAWVEAVALSRVLPSTIVVEVVERVPLAIARLDQRLYLVDRTGTIIDVHGVDHRDLDLPIVDGLLETSGAQTPGVHADRVSVSAALLADLDARPDLRQRVSQIDVSNPRDVVVMFDDDPAWLHVGHDRFSDRLQQYLDLRPALRDRFTAIDYVDLKFGERVYVKGQERRSARSASSR